MARSTPGRLEVISRYAAVGPGLHSFRVVCAVTLDQLSGSLSRSAAREYLKGLGWRYHSRLGWVSPSGRGLREVIS